MNTLDAYGASLGLQNKLSRTVNLFQIVNRFEVTNQQTVLTFLSCSFFFYVNNEKNTRARLN